MQEQQIIVALDVNNLKAGQKLVEELAPLGVTFKIGLEAITAGLAQSLMTMITDKGGLIFYDGKFYDIPNTVRGAAAAIAGKVFMFNLHASCQFEAIKEAVKASSDLHCQVLAVTVLTSFDEEECQRVYKSPVKAQVLRFARDAALAGVHGLVCSPEELLMINEHAELANMIKVVPGIRPLWAGAFDQKRIMNPGQAIVAGADYLVIGRPITSPPSEIGSPADAVRRIMADVEVAVELAKASRNQ